MAVLDEIVSFNGRRSSGKAGHVAGRGLCVVTCSDPVMTVQLWAALGLDGETVLVSVPGAAIVGGNTELFRAVAAAAFLNDCTEVLVLTHTQCRLAKSAGEIASTMQKRGAARESLPGDIRTFFGLQADPRNAARETATALRSLPFLPEDLLVHAAVLDSSSGALDVVERGENATRGLPSLSALGSLPSLSNMTTPTSAGAALPSLTSAPISSLSGTGNIDFARIEIEPLKMPTLDIPNTPLETAALDLKPSVQFSSSVELPQAASLPSPSEVPVTTFAVPPPQPKAPPAPRPPARIRSAPALSPALAGKVEKVRSFYVNELSDQRNAVRSALRASFETGAPAADLVKVVIKPVLGSGQKRYKVIDELLAIKEATGAMDRDACHQLLRQLID